MRGKKSDPEFVSQFMSQCLREGAITTQEMVQLARQQIRKIDAQIIEVEKSKIIRSKLLDVVITLDKPEPQTHEAKLLPLFRLKYPQTCREICKHIMELDPNMAYSIMNIKDPEVIFCIKQLLEHLIISRVDNYLVRGERFEEYLKFVLREES